MSNLLEMTAGPSTEPLSATQAKLHLRVDVSTDDTLITALIVAARMHVEAMTGRCLMLQTWRESISAFSDVIELQKAPLSSVTSVKYIDADGFEQTASSTTDYRVMKPVGPHAMRGTIELVYGGDWPTSRDQSDAVRILYVAGYADAASVPAPLIAAMYLLIGDLYQNREAMIVGTITAANPAVESLLSPFRLVWV